MIQVRECAHSSRRNGRGVPRPRLKLKRDRQPNGQTRIPYVFTNHARPESACSFPVLSPSFSAGTPRLVSSVS